MIYLNRLEQWPNNLITVAHVAETGQAYPGESVRFFTQVKVDVPVSSLTISITVPDGLVTGSATVTKMETAISAAPIPLFDVPYRLPETPQLYTNGRDTIWQVDGDIVVGTTYEFELESTVQPVSTDVALESQALVSANQTFDFAATSHSNGDSSGPNGHGNGHQHHSEAATFDTVTTSETAMVKVLTKGNYLQFLPALFYQDELMGRFLMLFESFWRPIEGQIEAFPHFFDPYLTPPEFLPWLAQWLHLVLDERWPEERRRLLLASAAYLYRKRGTKAGLSRYLEIYSGVTPEITEHRANNLQLGSQARLGIGIALGRKNEPHTFTVKLQLPELDLDDETDVIQKTKERRRTIEQIIESEKPAHTTYTLMLDITDEVLEPDLNFGRSET